MRPQWLNLICAAVAGLLLVGAGVVYGVGEWTSNGMAGAGSRERYALIEAGLYQPGFSRQSKVLYLMDCHDLPETIYGRLQPVERSSAFWRRCRAAAEAIARRSPSASLAWLTLAAARLRVDGGKGFGDAFRRSYETSPHLSWLALRRTQLAQAAGSVVAASVADVFALDIRGLLESEAGSKGLAARYVADPSWREVITEQAVSIDGRSQARFLDAVRSEMNGRAGR